MTPTCPYCNSTAVLVGGNVIYPHRPDLVHRKFWRCPCLVCDAYVGCHLGSDKPLGRLANQDLRNAKVLAHEFFDRLWRNGKMKRSSAYAWLAKKMKISRNKCHIGMFNVEQCNEAVKHCKEYTGEKC